MNYYMIGGTKLQKNSVKQDKQEFKDSEEVGEAECFLLEGKLGD